MGAKGPSLLFLLLSLATLLAGVTAGTTASQNVHPSHYASTFNRTLFPKDFLFGIGSSAYQVNSFHHIF
jgi:ABC-type transporter Mla maintaining outer membrane lipid asymmetry permease subunit MlaE